jgi:hypothetical protein
MNEPKQLTPEEQRALLDAISFEQLLADREATVDDIAWCTAALNMGILRYGGPKHDEDSVQDRLDLNRKMLVTIDEELGRRNCVVITCGGSVKGSEFFDHSKDGVA